MKAKPVFLSFLLFSICTPSFFCSAAEEPDAVLDTDGEELRAGVKYYVLSVFRPGGGLTVSSFGNEICPLSVVQAFLYDGLPVTFTPVNPKEGVVRVSTDLNIKFSTFCFQSNVWKVEFDEVIGKNIIVTSGVEGNPGRDTLSNWFKIEKSVLPGPVVYKFVFCPTVCPGCKVTCKDVGLFIPESGKRKLVLTDDQPYEVVFRKASTDDQPFSHSVLASAVKL